jgi:hypothetical protein
LTLAYSERIDQSIARPADCKASLEGEKATNKDFSRARGARMSDEIQPDQLQALRYKTF